MMHALMATRIWKNGHNNTVEANDYGPYVSIGFNLPIKYNIEHYVLYDRGLCDIYLITLKKH